MCKSQGSVRVVSQREDADRARDARRVHALAAGQVHLRLLGTTDLHAHVHPYDYHADRQVETVGLSRIATLVAQARAEAPNALLFDNGDVLQGNPLADHIALGQGLAADEVHPVIAAMNVLGYDAGTLGNHEFNYGLGFLRAALSGAAYPVVCANVLGADGAPLLPPSVILDRTVTDGAGARHPIRVGVIGLVPPQITTWDRHHLGGRVTAQGIVATAAACAARLKEDGADIVVALCHSGIGPDEGGDGMENASVPLAALPGIDAVLIGHQHLVFPGPDFAATAAVDPVAGTLHGRPAVMAGFGGSHLGVIDLILERDGAGWRLARFETAVRPICRNEGGRAVATVGDDPRVLAAAADAHLGTLAYVRRPVGRTTVPLHSHFALVGHAPTLRLVNAAQRWHVTGRLAGTEFADLPVLSAAAPFKAGGRAGPGHYTDVPAGDLAIRHVAEIYLFPNALHAVRVTGAELRGWLERSAGLFNRITPGQADQMLLNPGFPSYHFDVIDGVTWEIDLSQPARHDIDGTVLDPGARRIVNLSHEGRPVTDDMAFIVATNSYRAGGGGRFPGAGGDSIVLEAPDTNRDVILRYIAAQGTVSPRPGSDWRFAPLPGTSVLFDTAPGAVPPPDHAGRMIEPAGPGPNGFARFRIRL
jgi:2',3'-cyclic-nucleotide 2'-phosphodiesterase/3'-nucleotidase